MEGRQREQLERVVDYIAPNKVSGISVVGRGKGSRFSRGEKKIQISRQERFDHTVFIAAHEAGHAQMGHSPAELGVRPEVIEQLYTALGFAYGLNCAEDCADNTYIARDFPPIAGPMRDVYNKQFASEDAALHAHGSEAFVATFGYEPMFVQFGSNILRYWHMGRYSHNLDLDSPVRQALERVQKHVDEFTAAIPEHDDTEERNKDYARDRFRIFVNHIWPEMNNLVKQDLARQEVRELLKRMIQAMRPAASDSKPGRPPFSLDQLPEDVLRELLKKISQMPPGGGELPQLSPEEEDALRRALRGLSPEDRKDIEKRARQALEDLEDILDESLVPHDDKHRPPTHGQRREAKERINKEQERQRVADEGRQDAEEKAKEVARLLREQAERSKTEYDHARERVAPFIEAFVRDVDAIFKPNTTLTWGGAYSSGGRVNMKKVFEQIPTGGDKVFERKEPPSAREYRLVFLIDLSGSMAGGNKIEATFDATVFIYESLTRLGIPFEIMGFQDELIPLVGEYDPRENPARAKKRLGEMKDEVYGRRIGGRNRAQYNDDGYILQIAARRLGGYHELAKCLCILSDGEPVPSWQHSGPEYEIHKTVNDIMKESGCYLLGGGLGDGGVYVGDIYPNNFTAQTVAELIPKLKNALLKFVEHYADSQ